MKVLGVPVFDDNSGLEALSKNKRLASYPHLRGLREDVLAAYNSYAQHHGDPWHIAPMGLGDPLKSALLRHYEEPPDTLQIIAELRETGSPDVCPMCGSSGTGTLDHYLPKAKYPEFAVFTKNLVPACICNSKRKEVFKGALDGQRVLHPYFDTCMSERLVSCEVSGSFTSPTIQLVTCCGDIPEKLAVEFHVTAVVAKTAILKWLEAKWAGLNRMPEALLLGLPNGVLTTAHIKHSVDQMLAAKDAEMGTPNNWFSIFYHGIQRNHDAIDWIATHIQRVREGLTEAE